MQKTDIEDIIKKYNLYKGEEIDYTFFMQMYNPLEEIYKELEFVALLGIKKATYANFKYKSKKGENVKVKILLNRKIKREDLPSVLWKLAETHNLHKGKEISYAEFLEIYEDLKTFFTEVEFAKFLGISASNLKNIRRTSQKAKLFKNISLSEEQTEKIRKDILRRCEGKPIYYQENNNNNKGEVDFNDIYKEHRIYFSELEFGEILGISEKNLWYTKNGLANPKIKDIEKVKKIKELHTQIEEGKWYSKAKIEELCQRVDVSIEDFITYYINEGKFFDYSVYKEALEQNNGIYIGRKNISSGDSVKYIEILSRISRTITDIIIRKYDDNYLKEDMKSNILVYILENCGDLIENFKYDTKIMERMIWLKARKYAQVTFFNEYKKDMKEITLDESKNPIKDYEIDD